MSEMPAGIPHRPPPARQVAPRTSRSPQPVARLTSGQRSMAPEVPPRPRPVIQTYQQTVVSTSVTVTSSSSSGFSSYLGSTAGFASKARAALSTASSYVASAATQAAAVAAANAPSSERRQAWEDWARDWRDGRRAAIKGEETIHVLPGWAVKRPRNDGVADSFDLHLSVNGFCTFVRDVSSISRTQRALLSLAKRLAALPALPPPSMMHLLTASPRQDPKDLPDLPVDDLKLDSAPPPLPPRRTTTTTTTASSSSSSSSPRISPRLSARLSPRLRPQPQRRATDHLFDDPQNLLLAHEYLDQRLAPFWSAVLAFRRVTVSIYPVPLKHRAELPTPTDDIFDQEPLFRTTFTTNAQGQFNQTIIINWEQLCTHPNAVPLAFADDPANAPSEWGLAVRAELLPEEVPYGQRPAGTPTGPPGPNPEGGLARQMASSSSSPSGLPYAAYAPRRTTTASMASGSSGASAASPTGTPLNDASSAPRKPVTSTCTVSISRPGGVRVISDLDDTVKHSDILGGPREVFRNVFCRRLEDLLVPGMNKLYHDLQVAGLTGLHFVSNSPFELFPIVDQFLKLHHFPGYFSLKLKFYGGRSIVTSLFEPAGQRKRPSVLEIMDEFYDSKFILFGDSGEQDLELYTAIAHERPEQVAAIFIRDVTTGRADGVRLNNNTTGGGGDAASGFATPSLFNLDDFTDSPRTSGAATPSTPSTPGTPSTPKEQTAEEIAKTVAELQELSAAEQKLLKRAADWETRVQTAYDTVPASVRLVFFKETEEIEDVALGVLNERNKTHYT